MKTSTRKIVEGVMDLLEEEFQLLTAIEQGTILGGSGGPVPSCPIANVNPVIVTSSFVGWVSTNCYTNSQSQMAVTGYGSAAYSDSGTYQVFTQLNGVGKVNSSAAAEGTNYINCELQKGEPVMVGVNHGYYGEGESNKNTDGTTDHFIVIVGSGISSDGRSYYRFYDNATEVSGNGTSPNNRLYYNPSNGTLIGNSDAGGLGTYQVTQIRKTICVTP